MPSSRWHFCRHFVLNRFELFLPFLIFWGQGELIMTFACVFCLKFVLRQGLLSSLIWNLLCR